MSGLTNDVTTQILSASMDRRLSRAELLASNIANADTPLYQPKDLEFEGALQHAIENSNIRDTRSGASLARNSDRHLHAHGAPSPLPQATIIERPDTKNSMDGNGVDLDKEMARLTDNNIRFNVSVQTTRKRLELLSSVIRASAGV